VTVHGFELLRDQTVAEINSQARIYRHVKTGARLLSLENDDENKVFAIAFATPPSDDTGVAHIMEHSVLGGSRKYPLKDPFKELLKGSLQTFLNAFTAPDKTMYPVASQNLHDFYNLVGVYLDAVFQPLLAPETFQQQGWHYEIDSMNGPLSYKGVVFNEMKGQYSSPDTLIAKYAVESLFPDTIYRHDSGGDPRAIPGLTYEQFRDFHRRYYHPANAYICFYGDDHSDERLRILDDYLSNFDPLPPAPPIPLQPRLNEPRSLTYDYDAGQDAASARKAYLAVNWLLHDITDVETSLALEILAHSLVGTPASPLRKALIDSGLGEDLIRGGFDDGRRQAVFSTGLKGITVADADKVERLILDTLARLTGAGIDRNMILASLNTIEFRLREQNSGGYPRGLMQIMAVVQVWMYGGDPLSAIAFESPLNSIKKAFSANPRYFESLMQAYLLANMHRTRVLLKPDADVRRRMDAEEQQRLSAARVAMSSTEVKSVIENVQRLHQVQNTPDSPEALAAIPSLTLADLDKQIKRIPLHVDTAGGVTTLYHDLFTNGILYLDVGFNLRSLPQQYLPYAGLFGKLWLGMGTKTMDFVRLSQAIGQKTGGIGPVTYAGTHRDGTTNTSWLFLRGKSTTVQAQALLDILLDVLLGTHLDNRERLRQIVLAEKAGLEAALLPRGHGMIYSRLRSRFSEADWLNEQISGMSYLFFIRRLAERIEHDWPSVLADLQAVQQVLVNRDAMIANVTIDQTGYAEIAPRLSAFTSAIPARGPASAVWQPELARIWEGLTIPTQVNYVGKAARLYDLGYRLHGSAAVIVNYLHTNWMWERVRVQGGAYGGFCVFDDLSGVLGYLSYRDPNLVRTLQTYDETPGYLRTIDLTQQDLTRAIIGAIGRMDAYELPDARGYTSMLRYLTGTTDEIRQRLRDEILSTGVGDFRAFADVLDGVARHGIVAILGSEQAIAAANKELGNKLYVTKAL